MFDWSEKKRANCGLIRAAVLADCGAVAFGVWYLFGTMPIVLFRALCFDSEAFVVEA